MAGPVTAATLTALVPWVGRDPTVLSGRRGLLSETRGFENEEPMTLPIPDELADWIERSVPRERRVAGERLYMGTNRFSF